MPGGQKSERAMKGQLAFAACSGRDRRAPAHDGLNRLREHLPAGVQVSRQPGGVQLQLADACMHSMRKAHVRVFAGRPSAQNLNTSRTMERCFQTVTALIALARHESSSSDKL
jgi:hypothetical protein